MRQNLAGCLTRSSLEKIATDKPHDSQSEVDAVCRQGVSEMERLKEQLSIVVHELRTPLALIVGHAGLLQRNLINTTAKEDFSKQKNQEKALNATYRSVEAILHQAEQMNYLITQLYEFSEVENWQSGLEYRKLTKLDGLIKQVINQQSLIHPTHHFRLVSGWKSVELSYDSRRIEQVLNNLVNNAVKYSPLGSEVTVGYEVSNRQLVTVWVQDQGYGIQPEEQERIFEQFCRANAPQHNQTEGLGLGLYICRQIVQQYGGHIWLKSQVGAGSTFYFSLALDNYQTNQEARSLI